MMLTLLFLLTLLTTLLILLTNLFLLGTITAFKRSLLRCSCAEPFHSLFTHWWCFLNVTISSYGVSSHPSYCMKGVTYLL